MYLKDQISYKKLEKYPYKVILFSLFILILPAVFKFFDHNFQRYFGLTKYLNVFDFIFFGFLIFCFIKKEKLKFYFSLRLVLLVFYLLIARLSIIFSEGEIHHKAFYDLFISTFLIFSFLIFFTPYFKKKSEVIIKIFLMIFFSITLFESIVGILQFILQKPLGFSLLKEPLFGVEINTSAKIFISQKNQIFFNALSIVDNNCFLRAHGTFIHPNVFSGFLNVSSLLTLYLIYKSKRKLIFSLFLFIQLTSLILTFSRAGFISFICSSFLFFLLMFIKKYDVKKMLITFLIVLVLVGCLFSKYLIERGYFGHFFQSNEAKEINLGSSNVRILLKNVSINMIKQNPYFGIGFRNFLIKRGEYTSQITERAYVHNIYLLIAAETGIISFFVFLIFLILIFVNTLKCCLNPLTITSICIVISFLLIGFFDHYPISSYFGRMILFVFLGFLNYSITINKLFSYSQKVLLCQ